MRPPTVRQAVADTMTAEERQATVLLADISGFTAISERLDPERVTEVMNRCFEAFEGIVVAQGGEVNNYLGDCVVAVFGDGGDTRGAREAIEAALEIRATVARLNRELKLPGEIGVHAALETGSVRADDAGLGTRRERTISGYAVRAATSLEDESATGEILVGPLAREAAGDEYEFRARGGSSSSGGLEAFELLGPRERLARVTRPSERRQATVLFLEILGLDHAPQRTAPGQRFELLNRCRAASQRHVQDHGGVVDKCFGDGMLALFGVPDAVEDAPLHAVSAALAMRRAVEAIARDADVPLTMRAGINTGLVIAGEMGGRIKRAYTVIGDSVNVASRIKDAAYPNAIWVGPATHRATSGAVRYRGPTSVRLKGKQDPVLVWEVDSESAIGHRLREQHGTVFSKLVGRDAELAAVRRLVSALASGNGGAVSIVGEAGLGKSRLMAEALAVETTQGIRVLEARSTAVGAHLSFHPFVALFRQWAGIEDDTAPGEVERRLRDAIAATTPQKVEESFPFIATLLGIPLSGPDAERLRKLEGDALQRILYKTVRELLTAISEQKPLLLLFEDLHWADQSSIALLESLFLPLSRAPVLFVLVYRPDYVSTSERIVSKLSSTTGVEHTAVRLRSLSSHDSERLIHGLIPIDLLPQATRRVIVTRAEGNPYYLEEVVRSLVDLGAIEATPGGYRVTERIETVEIPGTVQEIILARVDRLEESTRHVLQLGAVIGRSFYYSLMRELLRREGTLDARLDSELGLLKGKQLLQERGVGWSVRLAGGDVVQEVEYLFQHVLAQEAIYESLLQRTRRELHGTVATAIEKLFSDRLPEFYPMLAYHFSRAEELEKAEDYLFKAGERAATSAASKEALGFFEDAARLYLRIHGDGGDPHKRSLLEKNIGSALLTTGQLTEAIEHYDMALDHLGTDTAASRPGFLLRFAVDLSTVIASLYLRPATRSGRHASATEREIFDIMFRRFKALTTSDPKRLFIDNIGLVRRMNALDPTTVDRACLAYCLGSAAFAYSGASFAISRRFLDRAKPLVDRNDVTELVGYEFTRFTLNFLSGEWAREPGIDDEIVERGIRGGVFWDVNSYLGLECDRQLRMGRYTEASRYLERLARLGEVYGYEFAVANHDGMQAMLLLERRQVDAALAAVHQYLEGRHEGPLRVLALGMRAKARLLRGESELARADLDEAEALLRRSAVTPPWHLSAHTTAELRYLADGIREGWVSSKDARSVRRAVRRALRVAARVAGAAPETYRLCAHIAQARGQENHSTRWWERAHAACLRLGVLPELARTSAESANAWRHSSCIRLREDSSARLEEARKLWRDLGFEGDPADAGATIS